MSYPPLPSNGETEWGNKFRAWADALEGRKVEGSGSGMTLRHDTSVGERVFLDHPGGSTMLHGDTGWRALHATHGRDTVNDEGTNAITWHRFKVRRINNQVFVAMSFVLADSVSTVDSTSVAYPAPGFGALPEENYIPIYGSVNLNVLAGRLSSWTGGRLSGRVFFTNESYISNDSWPTTLPGTPN